MVQLAAMSLSFYGHVYLDKQYHLAGSWLDRFSWFKRKQQLHFIHHRHADCNFAVIDYFWDRLLGTYRGVEATRQAAPGASLTTKEIGVGRQGHDLLNPVCAPRSWGYRTNPQDDMNQDQPSAHPAGAIRQPPGLGTSPVSWNIPTKMATRLLS